MARFNYRDSIEQEVPPARGWARWFAERPQMPYLLPFFAFLLVMAPGSLGHVGGVDWEALWKAWHPFLYGLKSFLAALLLWYFWPYFTRVYWGRLGVGLLVGLFGTLLWIASEYACQYVGISARPDPATFYNPDVMLAGQGAVAIGAFLCVRVAGPTLVVPFMEELFFRDFLMRAIVRGGRFQDVAVGTFTWLSLFGTSLLFGLNHGRMWIPGILYGLLMGVLLIRTKSLGACIVAHGTTNFTLYLYVIYTGDWQFM